MKNDIPRIIWFVSNVMIITRFNILNRNVNFEEMFLVINQKLNEDGLKFEEFSKSIIKYSPNDDVRNYLIHSVEEVNLIQNTEFNEQLSVKYFDVIKSICLEALRLIQSKLNDQAYHFLDLFHNTPFSISLSKRKWNPLRFWLNQVRLYRKLFNRKTFLRNEQQELMKKKFGFRYWRKIVE